MRLNPLLPFPYETAPLPITIRQPSALPTFRVLKHFQVQILHRSVMRLGERTCASTPRHATHTSLGPCYPPTCFSLIFLSYLPALIGACLQTCATLQWNFNATRIFPTLAYLYCCCLCYSTKRTMCLKRCQGQVAVSRQVTGYFIYFSPAADGAERSLLGNTSDSATGHYTVQ